MRARRPRCVKKADRFCAGSMRHDAGVARRKELGSEARKDAGHLFPRRQRRRSAVALPGLRRHAHPLAEAAAGDHSADAVGDHRPGLRPLRRQAGGGRPHQAARRRAAGRAHHRQGPRARRSAAARCPTRWSRSGSATPPAATSTSSTSTRRRSIPTSPARGRCVTDAEGRYQFITIKPGAYPWRNHPNAWRPAHIHFSLFGPSFLTRLVTQMYFPGDPLFPFDPIFNSVPDR